ncbi:MAG TPA: J domain-containing protein [Clostridiaceae bacterium]|nr:J domain-containing protein [Clostridiaceae bacterium]
MSDRYYSCEELKTKIRSLKKLERKIRFPDLPDTDSSKTARCLVWDEFFDLNKEYKGKAKYSLSSLTAMTREGIREVIDEYFFHVYYRYYKENGIIGVQLYDPDILSRLGLPIDADSKAIKKKFRELAKKYHPDTGGDSKKFIELMEAYKKLTDNFMT